MLNTKHARWVDFVLYAKLHNCKELQRPQHSINGIHNFIWINVIETPLTLWVWFSNLGVDTWVRKIDTIAPMWIPFDPKGKLDFHLQEPKISSLSICVILVVKEKLSPYFKITFISCFKSPYWVVLWRKSSLLSSP